MFIGTNVIGHIALVGGNAEQLLALFLVRSVACFVAVISQHAVGVGFERRILGAYEGKTDSIRKANKSAGSRRV